jgi:hypothetical protein
MIDVVYVFDVVTAIIHPVTAKPGEVLVVRPGTAHPVLVVRRGTTEVLREGPPNYGALAGHLSTGTIVQRALCPVSLTG